MPRVIKKIILGLNLIFTLFVFSTKAFSALWVSGYYPAYKQCDPSLPVGNASSCDPENNRIIKRMPPHDLDFSILTHVIHFALTPGINPQNNQAAIDETQLHLNPDFSRQLVNQAHKAHRKALLCVGGAGSADGLFDSNKADSHISKFLQGGFRAATASPKKTEQLVDTIINMMETRHYDGIDVDWEPLCYPSRKNRCQIDDTPQYIQFIKLLRNKLNARHPQCTNSKSRSASCPLLTAAVEINSVETISPVQAEFDQINIMTYGLAGPWFNNNWMTWFNAPLYNTQAFVENQGYRHKLASVDSLIAAFSAPSPSATIKAIPAKKLGLGLPFFGISWTGGDHLSCTTQPCGDPNPGNGALYPRQVWTAQQGTPPLYQSKQFDYQRIMSPENADQYGPQNSYWDYDAQSSYLSVDKSQALNHQDNFISYEDSAAIAAKVHFAQAQYLGGLMIWEVPAGYLAHEGGKPSQPLMSAIKSTLNPKTKNDLVIFAQHFKYWHNQQSNMDVNLIRTAKAPTIGSLKNTNYAIKLSTSALPGELRFKINALQENMHPAQAVSLSFALKLDKATDLTKPIIDISLANPWQNEFPQLSVSKNELQAINSAPGWFAVNLTMPTLNPWGRLFNQVKLFTQSDSQLQIANIEFLAPAAQK